MTTVEPVTPNPAPTVHVVILNWNGWSDTLACLESLQRAAYANLLPVVVDNGSTNDSVARIAAWVRAQRTAAGAPVWALQVDDAPPEEDAPSGARPFVLLQNATNLGFAAGCNVGLRFALAHGADYVWLLNNDTLVEPAALPALVACAQTHPEISVWTPQIRLHNPPDRIWNCGGYLTWNASRRYLYAGARVDDVPQQGVTRVTYVTGCALFAPASLWRAEGLLTERFFFGEEDYEFARRMRKRGRALGCCFGAVIQHKVGQALGKPGTARIQLHYLNRFVHMRDEWPRPLWHAWRLLSGAYILPMLRLRFGVPLGTSAALFADVLRQSNTLERVDKATFDALLNKAGAAAPPTRKETPA